MTTSGSTDFTVTGGSIIKDAAGLIFSVSDANDIDPTEKADALRFLNMMVKSWSPKVHLWPTIDVQFTLTPGTESYTVKTGGDINTPRPLELISCRRENSSGTETEVVVVSRKEYKNLPTKSTQAPVNIVYYDPQRDNGVLYVWPTGSTNDKILNLTFKRPLEDFDNLTDTPDFPQEWYLAVVYNLAVIIAPLFGFSASNDVIALADRFLNELMAYDTEDEGLLIVPNLRG